MVSVEKGVTFKLFAGFLANSELKMNMKFSPQWKEHEILKTDAPGELQKVHFETRDYLGIYLPKGFITLLEINAFEIEIRKSLQELFPKSNLDALKFYLFTQAFIQ